MSQARTTLPEDDLAPFSDACGHRRRSARQVRHDARAQLHQGIWDEDVLEDEVCPLPTHDVGRRPSPRAKPSPKPGRRGGFKVWKTPFWKRRSALWAERNAVERSLAEGDGQGGLPT